MKPAFLIRLAASIVFILSLATVACSAKSSSKAPGTITDDFGDSVVISSIPQRIVSLAPSDTEMLFALGLGDKVVGVDSYSDYPVAAKNIEKVGGFSDTDVEKVVSLHPDLVVAADIQKADVAPRLRKAGLTVIGLDAKDLEGVIGDIRLLGRATGTEDTADKLAGSLQSRLQAVESKVSSIPESQRPTVFMLTFQDPLWTAGTGTLENDIIVKAGGVNVASGLSGYAQTSLENVVGWNPQVILASSANGMATLQWAQTDPRLANVLARSSNPQRVYSAPDIYAKAAPRAFDALEELAKLLHPELF